MDGDQDFSAMADDLEDEETSEEEGLGGEGENSSDDEEGGDGFGESEEE